MKTSKVNKMLELISEKFLMMSKYHFVYAKQFLAKKYMNLLWGYVNEVSDSKILNTFVTVD